MASLAAHWMPCQQKQGARQLQLIKHKASIAAIFRSTLNTSYLHYVIITQRHAQVLRPLCVAFNEEIVRGDDLFPS